MNGRIGFCPEPVATSLRVRSVWALLLLSLVVGFVFFAHLGGYPLFDVDEGAFAEATREMLASGDYGFPMLDGAPRFDKPILIYWLQAAAMALFGVDTWSARLPSAVAAVLWVFATWHFARHRFGARPALLAAAILATAIGPWAIGRAATADAWLNLWLALAAFDAWRHIESHRRAPLIRAYLWMALGFLTKGPVAVLVPGAAVLLYCTAQREWRRFWAMLRDPIGWLVFLAVALPWYGYALWREGWAFVEGFFLKHNVQRFADTLERHGGDWWYFLAVTPLLLAPWTFLLVPALTRIWADRTVALRRFLWFWAVFVVIFFSLAQTKLPHYALYGITPLALLLANHQDHARGKWLATVPVLAALIVVITATLPALLVEVAQRSDRLSPFHQALAASALEAWPVEAYLAAGAVLLLIVAFWRCQALLSSEISALLSAAVVCLWLAFRLLPWAGEVLQGPIQRAAVAAQGKAVVNVGLRAPSFSFYRQAITPKRPPEPGEWFVTRIDRLPEFPYTLRYEARGVVLGERTP